MMDATEEEVATGKKRKATDELPAPSSRKIKVRVLTHMITYLVWNSFSSQPDGSLWEFEIFLY